MNNRSKSLLSGVGFYTILALCVAAVGVGAWFLLFNDGETADPEVLSPQTDVTATAPELTDPVTETASSAELPVQTQKEEEPVFQPDDTPVVAAAPALIVSPLSGEVVSAFSVDQLAYNETLDDWRTHDGIDISAALGTKVLAACAGTVVTVTDDDLLGTTVVLNHADGYQSTYANLQAQPPVNEGDVISAGQVLGTVGETALAESAEGPHLHFSVTRDGDPVDPDEYLNR